MFMGLFAHMLGVGRVLFAGLRYGDVTVWYQSKGCINGPLWAMKDAVIEGRITFYVQQNNSNQES